MFSRLRILGVTRIIVPSEQEQEQERMLFEQEQQEQIFSLSLKFCSVMPFPHAFADDQTQFQVSPYSGLLPRASTAIRFIHLDSILSCRSCLIWSNFGGTLNEGSAPYEYNIECSFEY